MTVPSNAPDPAGLVAEVRKWCQVSPASVDDAALEQVIAAELALQCAYCPNVTDDPWPPVLIQALYQRSARELAARGAPLGLVGSSTEFGLARVPSFDPEIERLEAPHRVVAFA